ncbi:hypothetical protein PIB30_017936 [Stylosanthes scabra]|uniref:Uncharacterized protein n=1 Tax=Stylosanthes scabra TaxID=79078 RepID=A0ABU6R837_9FABA|nr:hypothetical protein [Stylosanthes scabra]
MWHHDLKQCRDMLKIGVLHIPNSTLHQSRFLMGTKDLFLQGKARGGIYYFDSLQIPPRILAFADVDWASDLDDRRSINGFYIYLELGFLLLPPRSTLTQTLKHISHSLHRTRDSPPPALHFTPLLQHRRVPHSRRCRPSQSRTPPPLGHSSLSCVLYSSLVLCSVLHSSVAPSSSHSLLGATLLCRQRSLLVLMLHPPPLLTCCLCNTSSLSVCIVLHSSITVSAFASPPDHHPYNSAAVCNLTSIADAEVNAAESFEHSNPPLDGDPSNTNESDRGAEFDIPPNNPSDANMGEVADCELLGDPNQHVNEDVEEQQGAVNDEDGEDDDDVDAMEDEAIGGFKF